MKIRTFGFWASLAAIALLALTDHWGAREEIKVILVCILAVVAGHLL